MTEWLLSAFTTAFGLGGIALAVGAVVALAYLPRLAPWLLLAAAACGAVGYVQRLQDDLDAAEATATVLQGKLAASEADARRLSELANANAAAAREQAADNRRQAETYRADAAQARTDKDRADLARQAAEIAAAAAGDCPAVSRDVHSALIGRPVSEDAGLPASLKAASEALRKGKRR